ncbi:MAG: fibro-slime domain-containing protein [Fibromonadaceae bacterium]|jgi:fibro-slime domain-containing protein|nr:fibro-slime domain-containing protein [Fibromonadaceae bacterium]
MVKKIRLLLLLLASNALAQLQAYNFYFLPPHDDEWTLGTPYLVWRENNVEYKEALSVDSRCGWYRYTFNGSVPDGNAWVWLNTKPDDQVGAYGLDEDPVEWANNRPTPFNLAEKFGENREVFFDPELGEKGKESGWTPIYSGKEGICRYKFAAIIYHTNDSANRAFTTYGGRRTSEVEGIVRGIAKPTLENGKIQFNTARGTDWTAENFRDAFKDTPTKNVQRCFDMPFTRRGSLWEFDALYFCQDGTTDYDNRCSASGGRVGAFYPPSLMKDIDEYGDYRERYSMMKRAETPYLCGNNSRCLGHVAGDVEDSLRGRRVYDAEMDVRPDDCVNMWCFDRGWYGGNCPGTGRTPETSATYIPTANRTSPATVGDLSFVNSTTSKEDIDSYMETICWKPFKAAADTARNSKGDLYDYGHPAPMASHTSNNPPRISSLMCFESAPATFIYKPGQEFFFRGDDDIWVFINKQLVVDLGGSHGPAPGYVHLDTIKTPEKLVPGKEYDINIFFCDRRTSGSNVRISTNMYFTQQNGIIAKGDAKGGGANICLLQDGGNGSCAAAFSSDGPQQSSELCGSAVNGKIEFYIINRKGDDKRDLKIDDTDACKSLGNQKLLCYGGVEVDMSTGTAKVVNKDVVGLPGTWYLYARVKEGEVKPQPEDIKIATITTESSVRMAWGDIKDGSVNGATVTNICKNPSIAATGELVPVCFSGGDFDISGKIFLIDDIEAIGGRAFKLETTGFTVGNSRLKVFFDSLGTSPVRTDTALTIPIIEAMARPYSGSKPGVLVLWVTGDYNQDVDTAFYKVNVYGRPSDQEVVIKSVIPQLQWIRAAKATVGLKTGFNYGSKWKTAGDPESGILRNEDNHPAPIWVGEVIKLNLRAQRDGKTCKTCNYPLSLKAEARAPNIFGSTFSEKDGNLIVSAGMNIVNGEAEIEIAGKKDVQHPYYAYIIVQGVSTRSEVMWDSLTFQEPPTPFPESARIFDVNGDGIGDSLVIIYNRGFRRDSLPNAIEVKWDTSKVVTYGITKRTWDKDKNDSVYAAVIEPRDTAKYRADNVKYWTQYLKNVDSTALSNRKNLTKTEIEALNDTIILRRDPDPKEEKPVSFSKSVLTRSEIGKIANWVSFESGEGTRKKVQNIALSYNIEDKIPAIVIGARYLAGEIEGCGLSVSNPCRDKLTLEFSEPVIMDTSAESQSLTKEQIINPFAYMLRDYDGSKKFDILTSGVLPDTKYWYSRIERPSPDRNDSIVNLIFNRYNDGVNKSPTPMPGDSVKFAAVGRETGFIKNILMDTEGNRPNKNEIGRQIEGRKPFNLEKIPIGEIDPNYPDYIKNIIDALERNGSDGDFKDSLFNKDRPIELLPVHPDWSLKDVLREYPGTVGILLNPDIFNELADLEEKFGPIYDSDITLYPRVYFHTNLGLYVADRLFPGGVKCNDPIFPRNDKGFPSCRDSRSKFYIAWDMKDMKGRFVGSGAYVGLYDFRWEVFVRQAGALLEKEKIERKVEMHGVKRVRKK